MIYTSENSLNNRPQGAFRGRYDLTGGVAWCASPCATLSDATSGLVLYSDPTHSKSYRIDHGTDVPMGLTLLAEELGCVALCGTHSMGGDPTVERAVSDPIGRLGRVALPPVCDAGGGLDVMPPSALVPHSQEGHR